MVTYENECVGCPPEMGCMGSACLYRNVPHYYCDKCGCETKTLYEIGNEGQMCVECVENFVNEEFEGLSLRDKFVALDLDVSITKV